jgi:hypothetical protein
MSDASPIVLLTIAISTIVALYFVNKNRIINEKEPFGVISNMINYNIRAKPILWFVVDDYGTNNRKWLDFGSRSSTNLNMGFLSITKSRCVYTQGKDFDVRECIGREEVAKIIRKNKGTIPEYYLSCHPRIWRAWARAALLYYIGGLYFDGLSLCLGPSFLSDVNEKANAVFGTDHDEPRTNGLSGSCSPFAGWASGPGHVAWGNLMNEINGLINSGVDNWTSAIARNQIAVWYNKYLRDSMPTVRHSEWSRRNDGKPIEIEDLFGRSYNYLSPEWKPADNVIYVPLDYEKIDRSVSYKWFLKLSAEDILSDEANFLWAFLSKNILR